MRTLLLRRDYAIAVLIPQRLSRCANTHAPGPLMPALPPSAAMQRLTHPARKPFIPASLPNTLPPTHSSLMGRQAREGGAAFAARTHPCPPLLSLARLSLVLRW